MKKGVVSLETLISFNADMLTKFNQDQDINDAMKTLLLILKIHIDCDFYGV